MFVKASKKWLTVAKAIAYCTTGLITAVKSFMIQAPSSVQMVGQWCLSQCQDYKLAYKDMS